MNISRALCSTIAVMMCLLAAGCSQPPPTPGVQPADATPGTQLKKAYKDLIVGYVQLGAESEWRTANTDSVKEAAAQLGVELRFSDAQQKQENQISAIRALIAFGLWDGG